MWHRLWNMIKAALVLLLLLIIGACCIALYGRLVQGKDTIEVLGYSFYVVTSGSMEPEIHVGDLVIVRQCGASECAPGDVITFQDENGSTVTHRLQKKQGEKLVTKGDANNIPDFPVDQAQIKGKVVAVIHRAGWLLGFLSSRPGRVVLLAIGILLLRYQFNHPGHEKGGKKKKGKKPEGGEQG